MKLCDTHNSLDLNTRFKTHL